VAKDTTESPALSPEAELKTLVTPPGYRVELVAAEPLVVDPIGMEFDADGRLWVLEMPGFAIDETMRDSRDPIGRIVVLEDINDDGKMDKRTVFIEGLILPRAFKVLDKAVLIGEAPNLWLAKDTNGDLKSDTKELVRNDYGNAQGNIEHNANSLRWAMDNMIYTSEHTYHLRPKNGKFETVPTLSRGQWGATQDDAGRIFRNTNTAPLFADLLAPKYYTRNTNVTRTRGLYEDMLPEEKTTIWPIRPTRGLNRGYREGVLRPDGSATYYGGVHSPWIFRGDRLPKALQGNAFVCDSPTNIVHRIILTDDGTGRIMGRDAYLKGEFLASTDVRFRPVDLATGPDGTLYVADMYRGVVQDVAYQTEFLSDHIKLNKLQLPVHLGRIFRIVHTTTQRAPKPSLSKETPEGLVKALTHPNGWYRDTAQQLLVERADKSAVPALKQLVATATDYRAKLPALWTLNGLESDDADLLLKALSDVHPDVRAAAIRLSEPWLAKNDTAFTAAVIKKTTDLNWIVRRQLAASLGELPIDARVAPLTAILQKYGTDPVTVDAALTGLAGKESEVLSTLMQNATLATVSKKDAIEQLAGAVSKVRDFPTIQKMIDASVDAKQTMWLRTALLKGMSTGLASAPGAAAAAGPASQRGGAAAGLPARGPAGAAAGAGRGAAGRGRGGAVNLALEAEPTALIKLGEGKTELAAAAKLVASRLNWPGKPVPVVDLAKLTPEEEKRYALGQKIYLAICENCHQPDGRGKDKVAKPLAGSRFLLSNPGIPARIVAYGMEGATGLMPPQGATLSDEQIASVLTWVRRQWGNNGTPVDPADVKEARGLSSNRKQPWKEDEIARLVNGARGGAPPAGRGAAAGRGPAAQ